MVKKYVFGYMFRFPHDESIKKKYKEMLIRTVEFRHGLMRTHLAIFFADRGDVAVLKTRVIKSPNLTGWLYWRFTAINVENPRERAHLANTGEFNRRYLTCQISAILYADRGDRRKSQSLHRAHLAIFADRGDRRIKSPSVSLA